MQPIQTRVGAALACGKTRRTCENIKLEVALWAFVLVEGVEPANNSMEWGLHGESSLAAVGYFGHQ
jgi:hypothetical protein